MRSNDRRPQATRLLKHSIMAIEAPDVTLEEEGYEEELEGATAALRQALTGQAPAELATAPTQAADVTGSNPTPVRTSSGGVRSRSTSTSGVCGATCC